jgi:hypothetical protein
MLDDAPPEPWLSFLNALDVGIDEPVDLHCMGGFVVVQAFGLGRATADIDVLSVSGAERRGHYGSARRDQSATNR